MKLRKLYEQLLNEIGDRISEPPGSSYRIELDLGGYVTFEFGGLHYIIEIRIPIRQDNKIILAIDFSTSELKSDLTNQHKALKLMSYIVGSIESWCIKYKDKYFKNEGIIIPYITYNPKSEDDDSPSEFRNKRDRLYRAYIERFAKKYGSSVNFSASGQVISNFKPPLEIK